MSANGATAVLARMVREGLPDVRAALPNAAIFCNFWL